MLMGLQKIGLWNLPWWILVAVDSLRLEGCGSFDGYQLPVGGSLSCLLPALLELGVLVGEER
jgi:hypothetical protein